MITTATPADLAAIELAVAVEYSNGARVYDLSATGEQVGVAADGRIYWATDGGWDWVIDSANTRIRVEDYSYGSEFYLA